MFFQFNLTVELHLYSPKNHPEIHLGFHYGTAVTVDPKPDNF